MSGEVGAALLVLARNEPNRELIREVLADLGFAVQAVASPEDVSELLERSEMPALAIVDVDGFGDTIWSACRLLTEREVPVVVLTRQRTEAVQEATLKIGARSVLEKPLRKANLRAIARTVAREAQD